MPPTRAVETASPVAPPPREASTAPLRVGPLARLEAWWWTGPLGHLAAGASDLVPLFVRYHLHLARLRVARRLPALRGRH